MNTLRLRIGRTTRHFTGPSAWSELTPPQARGVMRLVACIDTRPEAIFAALTLLYRMRLWQLRWLFDAPFLLGKGLPQTDVDLTLNMGGELLETLRWIGQPDTTATFLLPKIRSRPWWQPGGTKLLAPDAGLGNLSFGEFITADQHYRQHNACALTATLYTTARPGQPRPALSPHAIARRARALPTDPVRDALTRQSFENCLRLFQRRFPAVFPKPNPQRKPPAPSSWVDVSLAMVALDPTRVAQLEGVNVWLALKSLNSQIEAADAQAERIHKLRQR